MHLAATILSLSATVGQCPTYSTESVNGPSCGVFGPEPAHAWGMSNSGHMLAGQSNTCQGEYFAIAWQPGGAIIPLAFPAKVSYGRAYDVNRDGSIVGEVDADGQGGRRGFAWHAGKVVFLQPPPGDGMSSALAVNDSGVAVASSTGAELRAVYWMDGKTILLQSSLPVGPGGTGNDINDINQICGWMGLSPNPDFGATPFIWHDGVTTPLPLPPYAAGHSGSATAINNLGDACGVFFVTHPAKHYVQRACAWIDGEFIDLGVLPGATGALALDINDAREIVGYCTAGPSGSIVGGFIWRDGVMHPLLDLVPGGTFTQVLPYAINSAGQIAGGAGLLPDNDGVAFRLTPALPATPGDTDCSGSVNIDDLLTVIGQWNAAGPVGGRPGDVNRDNRIDIEDLLQACGTGPSERLVIWLGGDTSR